MELVLIFNVVWRLGLGGVEKGMTVIPDTSDFIWQVLRKSWAGRGQAGTPWLRAAPAPAAATHTLIHTHRQKHAILKTKIYANPFPALG